MVGLGRAIEFAHTGEIDADRAYARRASSTTVPPMVQWIGTRGMRAALDSPLETTTVFTSNAGGILQGSEDAKEARCAFTEKRRPRFKESRIAVALQCHTAASSMSTTCSV
jgi:hypothetical protein